MVNNNHEAGDYKRQNGEDMKIHPEDFRRDFDLNGAYRGDNTGKLGPAEMFRCDQVTFPAGAGAQTAGGRGGDRPQ